MFKKFLILCLATLMLVSATACGSDNSDSDKNSSNAGTSGSSVTSVAEDGTEKLQEFYDKTSRSQELLDIVADDVYSYWYDCIYEDKYGENINYAIASALSDNKDNVDEIEALDAEIAELFKEVKDGEHGDKVKDVMAAYSDYYEHVINVSGSFNSYSENKEKLKKELASSLRDLSYEL